MPPRSSSLQMQYGYGGQQQGFGQQQQGYGSQQQGYGQPVQWRLDALTGVAPMPQYRFPALPKYWSLPYIVRNREDQVLGRWNMQQESMYVSRVQAMVRVLADGTPTLVGCGKAPTLVRQCNNMQCGMWMELYKGQTHILSDGDQVSLDAQNPEGAIFTCRDESGMQQQGGYGQRGGYGQQQQQQQLPPGWAVYQDEQTGQQYYGNYETGQTQWEPPRY